MGRFDSFVALRDFLEGKIDKYGLESVDKNIVDVVPKPELGSTILFYNFNDEDKLLDYMGLSQEDIYAYHSLNSYYGSEYYTEEMGHEDFNNGYGLWQELNDENLDKLSLISQFIMKESFKFDDADFLERFSKELYNIFPIPTRKIIMEYSSLRDIAMKEGSEDVIKGELNDFFEKTGIRYKGDGEISIELQTIFDKYLEMGVPHYPLKQVIIEILMEGEGEFSNWNDMIWESDWDESFDKDGFNNTAENELDSILEKLQDDETKSRKYIDMIQRVNSKHPQGYWKLLPKDRSKTVDYKVKGFDYDTMKIVVQLRKDLKQKEFKMTEENFNNLLYQPELFKIGELISF